jgi:hypothetical protein
MPRHLTRSPRRLLVSGPLLLSGWMLTACGGAPETELTPSAEPVGIQESALCSGASVTTLSIQGISSYGNEVAGSGSWAVSYPANAVHLDYYIDGVKYSDSEYRSDTRSGTWNFSYNYAPLSCGSHTFEVRGYPMIIDSVGNKTSCQTSGPLSASRTFTQSCPSSSVSCGFSGSYVVCDGSGSGGTGSPYTPLWQFDVQSTQGESYTSSWSTGGWTQSYYCPPTQVIYPSEDLVISFKVRDSSGTESYVSSSYSFHCQAGTYFYYDPSSGW